LLQIVITGEEMLFVGKFSMIWKSVHFSQLYCRQKTLLTWTTYSEHVGLDKRRW